MKAFRPWRLATAFLVLIVGSLQAQPAPTVAELARLVPEDFGFTLTVRDLRGHLDRWGQTTWAERLQRSPLGQFFQQGQEFADLKKFHDDLKIHLGVDWPSLRDDLLGDLFVLAYRSGPPGKMEQEEGLFLVRPRRPEVLASLVDKINQLQKKSGELKSLEPLEHRGVKYLRRAVTKAAHFYFQEGPVFAFASQEATIKKVIDGALDRSPKNQSPWVRWLVTAGADKAFLALAVNPRTLDAEIKGPSAPGQPASPNSTAEPARALFAAWQALDSAVLTVRIDSAAEIKMSILARVKELPEAYRRLFVETAKPSTLWQYFPERAIVSMAGQLKVAEVMDGLALLLPPEARKNLLDNSLRSLGALIGLDVPRDLYPNLGPDWGVCLFPATDPKQVPQLLAALAVRPGSKDPPVDQSLFKGLQILVGLGLFDYNRTHEEPIRLLTTRQGDVEVKYLAADKLFPAGFQPAFALKDGYLLLASSPEAISRFKKTTAPVSAGVEIPLLRLSATELARMLKQHRQSLVEQIAERNQIDRGMAGQGLDGALNLLELFDRFEWSHSAGPNQLNIIWRFHP